MNTIFHNVFKKKPWQVNWFIPELEHRKYEKAFRIDTDYSEKVNLYFGDLHKHSSLSPCADVGIWNGSPDDCYNYAKSRMQTDFLALTDHAEKISEEQWKNSMLTAERASETGKFIAWPAVEWAPSLYGHRNIYFSSYKNPLISGNIIVSPPQLWNYLRTRKISALTIPHHTARELLCDLTRTDDEFEPAFEIFSGWGNEEYYGAPLQDTDHSFTRNFAIDTLMRGFRMGFVAGGDGHPAPPANSGITGIYAHDLSLPSLFEALSARRTIATTGAKIKLDLHVNGFPVGSTVFFNQHQIEKLFPLEIGVSAEGTDNIEKIEIIENGCTVYTKTKVRALMNQMSFRWFRQAGPDDGSKVIGSAKLFNISRFIYARLTQRDGHMAWTSPIWLNFYYEE